MIFNFDEYCSNNEASNSQEFQCGGIPNIEEILTERIANKKLKLFNIDNELRAQCLIDKFDIMENFEDCDITQLDEEAMIEYWSILLERNQYEDDEILKDAVKAHFKLFGMSKPNHARTQGLEGLKNRLRCRKFWKRVLRKVRDRQYEHYRIIGGDVAKHKQCYASDQAVQQVARRRIKNAQKMAELFAVSDQGDVIAMTSIIEHSLANPDVRLADMMVKMRGYEEYAREIGHVNVFYTLTAPSKYHRYSDDVFNIKYDGGMSPREALRWLCKIWARIRAKLARDGIKLYGVRVCEPHKDGCPHYHLSLFMQPENVEAVNAAFRHYALQEDGDEEGAAAHRCKIEMVESASAYIVKYISKNLGLSINEPDFDHITYAQRVSTWASLWGVRQFQMIGSVPSGVWRELRKQREAIADETLEAARQAADQGDWVAYVKAMGGATVKRDDLPIKLLKTAVDAVGEALINQYGDAVKKVVGVFSATAELITRLKNWVIVHSGSAIFKSQDAGHFSLSANPITTRPRVNNCTPGQLLTSPIEENATRSSLEQNHDAHVIRYFEHIEAIKNKIVSNFQEIALLKAMDRYCISHVEAFKKYQKHLRHTNRRQDAHVRAYRKHLKRNTTAESLANDPVYTVDSIAA